LPSASFRQLLTKLTLPQLMDSSISAHEGLEPSTLTSCTAHINKYTLDAAKKEGMSKNTEITAFCDGAANCWSIVDSLESHCK
ncbi:hypothetical protein, partial [Candidatus Bandiella numerosa]|uniref:hypothetical protein n=1 Tax=Candidatus Bandiella numerosa TaxID=2570586 RepID=UPI001F18EBED